MNREQLLTKIRSVIFPNDKNRIDPQKHQDLEIEIVESLFFHIGAVQGGYLGPLNYNSSAPLPGKSGFYKFITAGPVTWIQGTPVVKIGWHCSVVYNNSVYEYVAIETPEIINNLLETIPGKLLDAGQGKILDDKKADKALNNTFTELNTFTKSPLIPLSPNLPSAATPKKYVDDVTNSLRSYIDNKSTEVLPGSILPENLSSETLLLLNNGGAVTNNADGEDLELIGAPAVLKLKDKVYSSSNFSGLARKRLRKNIVGGVNTLIQAMVSDASTIYIVQYDYDLAGETITMPANSALQFEGGSLKNGILTGAQTVLMPTSKCFKNTLSFAGSFRCFRVDLTFFDADVSYTDNSTALLNAVALSNLMSTYVFIPRGKWNVAQFTAPSRFCLKGENKLMNLDDIYTLAYQVNLSCLYFSSQDGIIVADAKTRVNIEKVGFVGDRINKTTKTLFKTNGIGELYGLRMSGCFTIFFWVTVFNVNLVSSPRFFECNFFCKRSLSNANIQDGVFNMCYMSGDNDSYNNFQYSFSGESCLFEGAVSSTIISNCYIEFFYYITNYLFLECNVVGNIIDLCAAFNKNKSDSVDGTEQQFLFSVNTIRNCTLADRAAYVDLPAIMRTTSEYFFRGIGSNTIVSNNKFEIDKFFGNCANGDAHDISIVGNTGIKGLETRIAISPNANAILNKSIYIPDLIAMKENTVYAAYPKMKCAIPAKYGLQGKLEFGKAYYDLAGLSLDISDNYNPALTSLNVDYKIEGCAKTILNGHTVMEYINGNTHRYYILSADFIALKPTFEAFIAGGKTITGITLMDLDIVVIMNSGNWYQLKHTRATSTNLPYLNVFYRASALPSASMSINDVCVFGGVFYRYVYDDVNNVAAWSSANEVRFVPYRRAAYVRPPYYILSKGDEFLNLSTLKKETYNGATSGSMWVDAMGVII